MSLDHITLSEIRRTKPDYTVFLPSSSDGSAGDSGNEHFLVFDGPDGSLMAVWTQSTYEGRPDQHIVFSRSEDRGETWSPPKTIAGGGSDPKTGRGMASWGFPLVSRSGRIYVLFNHHTGLNDIWSHTTGLMGGIYSDDFGAMWSGVEIVPMPRSSWDNPDPRYPPNWIVWQRPRRISHGEYYAGFTRWVSPAVRAPAPLDVWWAEASVVEFMRFPNIDEDPDPSGIQLEFAMSDERALQVGLTGYPDVSVVQEPSIVRLPDGRLFCVMRTTTGSPYYTISSDEGDEWADPRMLRYRDDGPPIKHPISPCPIYEVDPGCYVLFYHNHDGTFGPWGPRDTTFNRRPIYIARGEFREYARQPVWFSGPHFLMDNEGVPLGYGSGRSDLAMYSSLTFVDDEPVLWYPDRKFFLLGKKLPRKWLGEMMIYGKE
ncbi:MAG: exo-alpha-sialidase [Theionarchaea archaeon]|nr:exo-alpha-sialidase [Theionarchaea archaeon]